MRSWRVPIGAAALAGALAFVLFAPPPLPLPEGTAYPAVVVRGLGVLLLAGTLCLFRVFRGPTAADRIVAIDMFGVLIVGFCAILAAATGHVWYVDIAIAWALLSFIAALALAKHLEGRAYDD